MDYLVKRAAQTVFLALIIVSSGCVTSHTEKIDTQYMHSQGWSKLSVAVHRGDLVRVKELVSTEDLNHEGTYGDTPLTLAIEKKNLLIIELLLKNGANSDNLSNDFFKKNSSPEKVRSLVRKYQKNPKTQKRSRPALVAETIQENEVNLRPSTLGGTRTALIIGNEDYKIGQLKNPVNDATDMAQVLKKAGFKVITIINANRAKIDDAVMQFSHNQQGGTALFYYAGHAVQVDGHNYIIPIGEDIDSQAKVKYRGVDIDQILHEMGRANNALNIVVLDACRDNPLPKTSRSSARGLVRVKSPAGTIIAFATSPGKTAADGKGRNGIYTKYFLHYMKQPGLSIEEVLKGVSRSVKKATNYKQQPWIESSFDGKFVFFSQQN